MAVRSGMSNLITRWRYMVNDDSGGVWSSQQAQDILDCHRMDVYQEPLKVVPQEISGTVQYLVYEISRGQVEESGSGTSAWRFYNSNGDAVTATHTADYIRGVVTFSSDQSAATYYLDYRAYDLHGSAADGWRQRAADVAGFYSFGADGGRWSRSDWFEHCERLAHHHAALAWPMQVTALRYDVKP